MSRYGPTYAKACEMQRKLSTTMLSPLTDTRLLAQLASAWEKLEERKRILRMKPKPRDVDVGKYKRNHPTARVDFREPETP